jgi:hypothetical protein
MGTIKGNNLFFQDLHSLKLKIDYILYINQVNLYHHFLIIHFW